MPHPLYLFTMSFNKEEEEEKEEQEKTGLIAGYFCAAELTSCLFVWPKHTTPGHFGLNN